MSVIQERYNPVVVGSNSSVPIHGNNVGGFLCVTSGTVSLVTNPADGKEATTLFTGLPVTAGVYYPIPFYLGRNGGVFTSASGAGGCLGV